MESPDTTAPRLSARIYRLDEDEINPSIASPSLHYFLCLYYDYSVQSNLFGNLFDIK